MRIKLVVSYDGTDFCGWAPQAGLRTVQGTLTEAVRRVSGEEIEILGASRTDSGAHARGQVCHFDVKPGIPDKKWAAVLNRVLPVDIAVVESTEVSTEFHSRFSAMDRFYRYRIGLGAIDPMKARYLFHYNRSLDVQKMNIAAMPLLGSHDFIAFTEELDKSVQNTRRTLYKINVKQVRDEVWVDVVGTAFLRGMMRRIAGALFEVGRGKRPVEEVSRLLEKEGQDQLQWPVVLPASGLCLMRVRYGRHLKDNRTASVDLSSSERDEEEETG
jgi:tRNA pseudouridine38-40 synthase